MHAPLAGRRSRTSASHRVGMWACEASVASHVIPSELPRCGAPGRSCTAEVVPPAAQSSIDIVHVEPPVGVHRVSGAARLPAP